MTGAHGQSQSLYEIRNEWKRGREKHSEVKKQVLSDTREIVALQKRAGLDYVIDPMFNVYYLFQAFVSGASVHTVSKTNDSAAYTHTSIYESKIFDGRQHGVDASYYKTLLEATVMTEYMPTTGQIVLA